MPVGTILIIGSADQERTMDQLEGRLSRSALSVLRLSPPASTSEPRDFFRHLAGTVAYSLLLYVAFKNCQLLYVVGDPNALHPTFITIIKSAHEAGMPVFYHGANLHLLETTTNE